MTMCPKCKTELCPKCGIGHVGFGYGLAGGGIGSYTYCDNDECDFFEKTQDAPEDFQPPAPRAPEAREPEPAPAEVEQERCACLKAVPGMWTSGYDPSVKDAHVRHGKDACRVYVPAASPAEPAPDERAREALRWAEESFVAVTALVRRMPESELRTHAITILRDAVPQMHLRVAASPASGSTESAPFPETEGPRCATCGGAGFVKVVESVEPGVYYDAGEPCDACGGTGRSGGKP